MSIATAARLFEEFCDGTAEKDWRAWAEEALSLIEHRIPPEGRRERVAFYEEAMRDAKNHAALALELAYLREKADAPVSGEAATLLRIWQSNLGASRNQCDEPGRKLWDRIEAALGVKVSHAIGASEGLVLAVKGHLDGWASATFGWQDDPDPTVAERNRAAAIEAHAAECLRRIRETLTYGVGLPHGGKR